MAGEAAAAASSSLFAPPPLIINQQQQQQLPLPPPAKKKRNLPGTPDPDAEVIALSPRSLLATNRFVCEICGKGFQRDQNLQLHRRGHNLPWKLRQRSGKDPPRKRVYVCPEPSCVHHSASRALGDLTGIKKHFCRKHGEKKWRCDRCSKRYAVQSDWKAHGRTCGTREYRCDCGTLFSRRDSFVTHRAFCDALAEEMTAGHPHHDDAAGAGAAAASASSSYLFVAAAAAAAGGAAGAGSPPPPGLPANINMNMTMLPLPHPAVIGGGLSLWGAGGGDALPSMSSMLGHIGGGAAGIQQLLPGGPPQLYADLLAPPPQLDYWLYGNSGKLASSNACSELMTSVAAAASGTTASVPSVFSGQQQQHATKPADMSATALLQKAAQMGAVTSSGTDGGRRHQSSDGLLMMSQLTAGNGNGNMPYDDVLSSAVRHAGLSLNDDAAAVAVGREETRDFLGVGVHALCSSSLNGWI